MAIHFCKTTLKALCVRLESIIRKGLQSQLCSRVSHSAKCEFTEAGYDFLNPTIDSGLSPSKSRVQKTGVTNYPGSAISRVLHGQTATPATATFK